jgi:hypothetical protein
MILPFYLVRSFQKINIVKSFISYSIKYSMESFDIRAVYQGPSVNQGELAILDIKADGKPYKIKDFPMPSSQENSLEWNRYVVKYLKKLQATIPEKELTATASDAYFYMQYKSEKSSGTSSIVDQIMESAVIIGDSDNEI